MRVLDHQHGGGSGLRASLRRGGWFHAGEVASLDRGGSMNVSRFWYDQVTPYGWLPTSGSAPPVIQFADKSTGALMPWFRVSS